MHCLRGWDVRTRGAIQLHRLPCRPVRSISRSAHISRRVHAVRVGDLRSERRVKGPPKPHLLFCLKPHLLFCCFVKTADLCGWSFRQSACTNCPAGRFADGSDSCAAPDGMIGYQYYADDPFGYPNGYTNVPLAANGYNANRAGCRAACEADALGFDCVVFMSHPGDNCYLFAEGVATGWNEQGHTTADGGWTTYSKCGLRTAAIHCSVCGEGRYQGSQGQSSCIGCSAGRYHGSPGERTSNGQCTVCETGQYQASTASSSCTSCSAGSYRASTGATSSGHCITW